STPMVRRSWRQGRPPRYSPGSIDDPETGGMDEETQEAIEELHAMLERARVIVPFTGAGISTESGVPDFRSPGSPWMVNKPIPIDVFVNSHEARIEAWRRKFAMDDHCPAARPNRGH